MDYESATEKELFEELRKNFHPSPTDDETERGIQVIETLMKREKARLESQKPPEEKRDQTRIRENMLSSLSTDERDGL